MAEFAIDKIALIHIKDRKVLFARSKGKSLYYIPGGKREAGETDQMTVTREIKEELGVEVIPETLKLMQTFEGQAHGKPEGVIARITCYSGKFKGEIKPTSEIDELIWISSKEMDKIPILGGMIVSWLKSQNLID